MDVFHALFAQTVAGHAFVYKRHGTRKRALATDRRRSQEPRAGWEMYSRK